MSSKDQAPEDSVDTSQAGGLGEIIPEPLMPVWRRVETVQSFRETHGDRYVAVLELLTAVALTGGYVWWLTLFLASG